MGVRREREIENGDKVSKTQKPANQQSELLLHPSLLILIISSYKVSGLKSDRPVVVSESVIYFFECFFC